MDSVHGNLFIESSMSQTLFYRSGVVIQSTSTLGRRDIQR